MAKNCIKPLQYCTFIMFIEFFFFNEKYFLKMNQKDLNEKEYRLQKSYIHENVNKDSLWSGDFYQKLFSCHREFQ